MADKPQAVRWFRCESAISSTLMDRNRYGGNAENMANRYKADESAGKSKQE
jgi:hypothetical protein